MNIAQELRQQAKRIEKGWLRGTPRKPNEACMVAWIDSQDRPGKLSDEAIGQLRGSFPGHFRHAALWNDAPPSYGGPVNRCQVSAVLRRAADQWEKEQA